MMRNSWKTIGQFTLLVAALLVLAGSGRAQAQGCTPDDTTLCIDDQPGDGRYQIQVAYQTAQGGGLSGNGHAIALTSLNVAKGGLFWFFSATNPEMLVKVIDGCGVNNEKWVFYSAGTNVGLVTTVTDMKTGTPKVYTNADGTAAPPVQDTSAFPCSSTSGVPTASFTVSPANPKTGDTVNFTDSSTGSPTSWLWNFGDPGSGSSNTSTSQNPSHAFAQTGAYTVSLTAANASGTSAPATRTVSVAAGVIPYVVNLERFDYSPGTSTPIMMTVGQTYSITLHALDNGMGNGHGFSGVSALGLPAHSNILPGSDVTLPDVTPTAAQVGTHGFACTTVCGGGHSGMAGVIVVQM